MENEEFRIRLDRSIKKMNKKKKKNSNDVNEFDMKDLKMDDGYIDIRMAN